MQTLWKDSKVKLAVRRRKLKFVELIGSGFGSRMSHKHLRKSRIIFTTMLKQKSLTKREWSLVKH